MCAFGWQKYGEFFNPPNFLYYFFNIYSSPPHSFTFYHSRPPHYLLLTYPAVSPRWLYLSRPPHYLLLTYPTVSPRWLYLLSFIFYLLPFPPTIPKHNLSTLPLLCINLVTYVALPLYRGSLFYL